MIPISKSHYSESILFLIVTVSISFFMPSPLVLLMYLFLFVFLGLFGADYNLRSLLLVPVLLVALLNWTYIGVGIVLYDTESWQLVVYARVAALLMLSGVLVKFSDQFLKIRLSVFILLALIAFSFTRSDNISVAIQYLGNVYVPLLLSLHVFLFVLNRNVNVGVQQCLNPTIFTFFFIALLTVDFIFVILDICNLIDLAGFYSIVGELVRGSGSAGNTRTILLGFDLIRYPGIFADPIVGGYLLVILFFYFFLAIRSPSLKFLLLFVTLFLLVLTYSKGAYLLLALGLVGAFVYQSNLSLGSKKAALILIYTGSLFVTVLRALYGGVTDSSAIHALGLTLPFSHPFGANYFFGNDLGSGGNMGGWVQEGAESFVGLLMYNTGLFGVFLYLYLFHNCLRSSLRRNDKVGWFFVVAVFPVFWTSFLQENTFNLTFTVSRLLIFILVVEIVARTVDRDSDIRGLNRH